MYGFYVIKRGATKPNSKILYSSTNRGAHKLRKDLIAKSHDLLYLGNICREHKLSPPLAAFNVEDLPKIYHYPKVNKNASA